MLKTRKRHFLSYWIEIRERFGFFWAMARFVNDAIFFAVTARLGIFEFCYLKKKSFYNIFTLLIEASLIYAVLVSVKIWCKFRVKFCIILNFCNFDIRKFLNLISLEFEKLNIFLQILSKHVKITMSLSFNFLWNLISSAIVVSNFWWMCSSDKYGSRSTVICSSNKKKKKIHISN